MVMKFMTSRIILKTSLWVCLWRAFWINWGKEPYPDCGWNHPWDGFLDWIKRRKVAGHKHSSLYFLTVDVMWPLTLLSHHEGLYSQMVSQNKFFLKSPFSAWQRKEPMYLAFWLISGALNALCTPGSEKIGGSKSPSLARCFREKGWYRKLL